MKVLILKKNKENAFLNLSETIFNVAYNEKIIHQFIRSYFANSHFGHKKCKSRGEVRGGGRKPWKQKGTGRARAGSIRSPLWRGGGKVFAFGHLSKRKCKINSKIYNLVFRIIFSELFRYNRIKVIDDFVLSKIKTRMFLSDIKHLNINEPSLFISNIFDINLYLSVRNLKNIHLLFVRKINILLLLKFKSVFITESAIKFLEECI